MNTLEDLLHDLGDAPDRATVPEPTLRQAPSTGPGYAAVGAGLW